eukprot:CAMPEP_0181209232 /NCGR_PEP_ID=MMETSP1096-20121128/22551_1 /TAXON_ID=156174 ORGANISM="Chrysochromulina ericina, Strain CCMP281" /NCGR_SAMPLE_ID=MMETSP1096 /ASSEMBLY_ACC=CAM_ASM_000453 /LENGTH=275 /DNA_ID=CAMNT_0023300369 /DNA_START=202 /DNA_END=1031 /DNA_ORIENTATION=+
MATATPANMAKHLTYLAQPAPASADSFRGSVLNGTSIVDGSLALVLELMPGSLHQYLENSRLKAAGARPLDAAEARVLCKLSLETAMGLAYLHRSRYLHGDVKTLNVMLDSALHAKVCDFGISSAMGGEGELRSLPTDGSDSSQPGHSLQSLQSRAIGTLRYLAPELLTATTTREYEHNERCDVYSFGLLLWEVMHQQVVFAGVPGTQVALRSTEGKRPDIDLPPVCDALGPIMQRCWHADPKARPTMSACADDLGSVLKDLESEAAATAVGTRE